MFPRFHSFAVLTATATFAVLFLNDAAWATGDDYRIQVRTGTFRKRHVLPKKKTPTDEQKGLMIPAGVCHIRFDPSEQKWSCKQADEQSCRSRGISLFRKRSGVLGLDHYRTRYGKKSRALAWFCPEKGVEISKLVGRPVFFYYKEPGSALGFYLSVNTKQTEIATVRKVTTKVTTDDEDDEEQPQRPVDSQPVDGQPADGQREDNDSAHGGNRPEKTDDEDDDGTDAKADTVSTKAGGSEEAGNEEEEETR